MQETAVTMLKKLLEVDYTHTADDLKELIQHQALSY
jgi:hypothetical protein